MKVSVTKQFEFNAGHHLPDTHLGKCRSPHGHNYKVEVTVSGSLDMTDKHGMLLDFGAMSLLFKGWCNEHLDHAMILEADDPLIGVFRDHNYKIFVLPAGMRSSAEHLAGMLYRAFEAELKHSSGICLERVRLYETPTSWAEIRG